MKKKKICVVMPEIGSGGVEAVLLNFFSHMNCKKYDLNIITYKISNDYREKKFKDLGFTIFLIPPKKEGLVKSICAMHRNFKENGYDVVHAHMTMWNCIPMLLAWKRKVPIRISHSHLAVRQQGVVKKGILFLQQEIIKLFANKLCACGEDAAIFLYGRRTFENGKVTVIKNAIDAEKFKKNIVVRKDVRRELGISEHTFCIGHIGRFHEHKNHAFLLKIFKEIQKQIPDSKLLLVGDGNLKEKIIVEAKDNKIFPDVLFVGVRNDPERIYQAMDVFCLPSLYEGLPVVGIEAQAAGLPCVFSDGISSKVCITPLANMVSLSDDAKHWADVIVKVKDYSVNVVFPKDYDIKYATKEWEKLYNE